MDAGFFIGGMLGRVAGPIALDWFKYKTKIGREFAANDEETKKRMSLFDLDNKLRLSAENHKEKLDELEKQFQDGRRSAEEKMFITREDWQQKLFWEKCFPLRNPYELPLGYEPIFDESTKRLKGCRLGTVMLPNNRQIVPLRVITALKDSTHPSATSINADLSMFLINYFSANGIHAVVSDIGSWREDAPINDASVNYLFKGAKGQPTLVIMPVFTNGGTTVRLKVWSWGLGEDLNYPVGIDCGFYYLDIIRRNVLCSVIKDFKGILEKTELTLPPDAKKLSIDIQKLSKFEKFESSISHDDYDKLLSLLDLPEEIQTYVDRKTNEIVSSFFVCLAGMYADAYHLDNYGTLPLLPSILDNIKGLELVFPYVRDFYMSLANSKLIEGILTPEDALKIEFTLGEQAQIYGLSMKKIEPIVENLEFLLKKSENAVGVKENYRLYLQRKSNLLNKAISNT